MPADEWKVADLRDRHNRIIIQQRTQEERNKAADLLLDGANSILRDVEKNEQEHGHRMGTAQVLMNYSEAIRAGKFRQ